MLFQIEGADRSTGSDQTIIVDADSESDAAQSPDALKLFIARCVPMNDEPITSRKASMPGSRAPTYHEILKGSALLGGFGILCFLIGGVLLLAGIILLLSMAQPNAAYTSERLPLAMQGIIDGLAIIIAGALLKWLAGLGIAIRDIALNSFRQTNAAYKSNAPD